MVSFLQCPQQPPLNQEEAFPKMVQDSMSKIEIQGCVEKSAAKKRRVRKSLIPRNEASSKEPGHQLQQEEKCQKLVKSATNKSYDIAVSDTFRTMLPVSQTGRITARDVKTKVLLPLQSRKLGDVIRTVKNLEKGGVIMDAVVLEMGKGESPESVTQNVEVRDGKVQAGKPSSRNFVDVSEKPKQSHGQETVPGLACSTSYKKNHKIMNKHVHVKKSDIRENVKQATGFPVLTPHLRQVCRTHVGVKSQSITASNCPSASSSNTDCKAPSRCVHQGQKNETLGQPLGNVQAETDIICISDDSDDEVEWLCSKYNPKLDYDFGRKEKTLKKDGQSTEKIEGNLTSKQMYSSSKHDLCMQRNMPTCGMRAAFSTGRSVNTLPNQIQTLITNPNNNTTYLTHNSTILHDKVEEEFPVMHNHVGTHTVAENQDSVSEAVLTMQPIGSSHQLSGNSVLQTESVEHVQSHIPRLSTAKTVLSPIPSCSTQNNRSVPLRTQDTLTPKQTHNAPKSNPCVQRMVPTSEMEAEFSTGNSVNTLPNQIQTLVTNPNNNTTYLTHNSTILHDKAEEQFPMMHNHVGTHIFAENQDSVSEAVLTVQPSGSSHSASGNSVLQTESVDHVQSHIPGPSTSKTVLSPVPSYSTQNNRNVPLRTQDTLTPKHTHNAPKTNPCVQRMVPTSEIEAAASTDSNVATLPQYFQTPVTNPDNNTHNSTVIHDNIEEGFPVDHRNVGIYTATEDQYSVSEAVLTVQPSGSSHHLSGNSVLQTESVEHVQRHIPGLSTANTILSPLPLSSPQNNPNIPVHHSVAAGETITSVQHSSSMNNGPVPNLQINIGSQIVPSHVPASQGSNVHPCIFILGSSPGTSVIQVTTDTTNRPPHARTQEISSDAQLVRTNSPGFNSSTSARIPYPQLTQTRILTPHLADRARNCHFSVYQTNDNLPVVVRSSHLPSVQTRNPSFSSTPRERPHTPVTHTQHPRTLLASTRVPGIHLPSHTPEGQTRIPGTPLTKTRNSVTTEVQTRSPGSPVSHTSSAGTVLGKTRGPGTPVAHTSSSGTALGKTRSPGTPVAHTSSSGIVLGKTRSPGTPVAQTHDSGVVLGVTRSPGKICFSQTSSSGVSGLQARNSGSSVFRAQTPVAHVNAGARLPHGRGQPGSRPERDWTDGVQQRDQTARLVVIPGDDNVNRYGLVFPSGAKVILTPEQVAEIRAANGGLLTSNFGM